MKVDIIRLPETDSTNDYAIRLLSQNRPGEGCVIITDHQTKGKGLDTNTWESEKSMNLTFSLILYPEFPASQQFLLNKGISLGIYDFLKVELPGSEISIKWPNDIYCGDKKICGILIQNSLIADRFDYVVVGIGLNVNQTQFRSNAPNPVSIKILTGIDFNLQEMLEKLLYAILDRYSQVKYKPEKIEKDFQKVLYRMMKWHEYEVKGTVVKARITGTNAYGQLMLETETNPIIICDLKEVKFML
ncbi:MAG: biotin--[acetyl-CoA-carboxylase] ligase [Bacteroidota bacterium]